MAGSAGTALTSESSSITSYSPRSTRATRLFPPGRRTHAAQRQGAGIRRLRDRGRRGGPYPALSPRRIRRSGGGTPALLRGPHARAHPAAAHRLPGAHAVGPPVGIRALALPPRGSARVARRWSSVSPASARPHYRARRVTPARSTHCVSIVTQETAGSPDPPIWPQLRGADECSKTDTGSRRLRKPRTAAPNGAQ